MLKWSLFVHDFVVAAIKTITTNLFELNYMKLPTVRVIEVVRDGRPF